VQKNKTKKKKLGLSWVGLLSPVGMVMAGATQLDMGWYKKGVRPIFFSFLQFHSLSSSHALSSLLFFFSGSAMKIPMNLHLLRREMVAGGGWGAAARRRRRC